MEGIRGHCMLTLHDDSGLRFALAPPLGDTSWRFLDVREVGRGRETQAEGDLHAPLAAVDVESRHRLASLFCRRRDSLSHQVRHRLGHRDLDIWRALVLAKLSDLAE